MAIKRKPTKKITKKSQPTNHTLIGSEAKLLIKGQKIKQDIKDLTNDLEEVKEKLKLSKKGTYMTSDKIIRLVIGETKVYSELDPHLLFRHMKKEGMLKHYWNCVKAQLTTIKKHVPQTKIDYWRRELDPSLRWTWK